MDRAVRDWINNNDGPPSPSINADILAKRLNKSYTIHGNLLLLPSSALQQVELEDTVGTDGWDRIIEDLYKCISIQLKITHIAVNHPIPLHSKIGSGEDNVIRSPTNFQPVFGDFGPTTCSSPPTQSDLSTALWVTAKQNGIYQTWAPRWTMFSRGNVKEKARILKLPSVQLAIEHGHKDGRGSSAVDLYAGIGYFAFSYVKAGVQKVICWDLNPWSCEGLTRGAKANKWVATRCEDDENSRVAAVTRGAQLIVFNESNGEALRSLLAMRHRIPPVRHVNCGLLPSSAQSWRTAVQALDPELGGWMHIHENFASSEIEQRSEEVRQAIQSLADTLLGHRQVTLEHIERVKTYAPGVWHCVLDIHVMS
ncbi:hypothetical protein K431DRAFT_294132 [Polychaeton citri CBS 116435]|uniref:tRNA wybutosine-synthesizing protein 2 n=1 Tax=Polychaeton citri CBS 116435 TaxID=1314669 RepID=A0A9P4QAW6_9PEZI|nr:hypothetical protein K431DRAFT_294132 [Polychaeton citri CBS 116435]